MHRTFKFSFILSLVALTGCAIKKNYDHTTPAVTTPDNQIIIREKLSISPLLESLPIIEKEPDKVSGSLCYPACPEIDSKKQQLIYHNDFVLSYNIDTKYADWVAYKIDRNKISGLNKKRIWRADPKIPAKLAMTPSDYKGVAITCNYDRGHQAPLADFSNSPNWQEVNYLSNITPQKAKLNQGPWNNLESKIRIVAKEFKGDLYVLTGTYYNHKPVCKLPNARIANTVPNGYWKIVTLVTNDNNVYRASFKFDQETPKNANFCKYQVGTQGLKSLIAYSLNLGTDLYNGNSQELLTMLGCGD